MEKILITGVTLKNNEARISVSEIPDRPGIAAELFEVLATAQINVDMIVQSTGKDKQNTISFTIPKDDLETAQKETEKLFDNWKSGNFSVDKDIAIVSTIGMGMKSNVGIAAEIFSILGKSDINIEMISTSEIKISCVIQKNKGKLALKLLHESIEKKYSSRLAFAN